MKSLRTILLMVVCGGLLVPVPRVLAADPVESLKSYSDFKQVDLARLMAGDILAERGSLMNFPNGISVQTCFAVPYSAEETAHRIQTWNPSVHEDLKVFGYQTLHDPVEAGDFAKITFQSGQYPVRWLREKISNTTATKSDLNLSRLEAQTLAGCLQKKADPVTVAACWVKLLLGRVSAFQAHGHAGGAAYELGGENILPGVQLRSMLQEQPSIARQFAPILKQSGVFSGVTTNLAPAYYCNFFDADHKATITLGAIYVLPVDDHYQVLDTEYYVCASYYTSAILYEIWPIRVGDKTGTLVWRGDFFAAPVLGVTKGTERIAYGALMLQDVKKAIRHFKDDLKGRG